MSAQDLRGRPRAGRRAAEVGASAPWHATAPAGGLARRVARGTGVTAWLLAWTAAVAASATVLVEADVPGWVAPAGAGALTVLHTVLLSRRAGGRVAGWGLLVLVLVVVGLVWAEPWALSAVAVLCALTAAVAAVLVTRPAATFPSAALELVLAVAVASAGGVGVAAVGAPLEPQRFALLVVGAALALTIAVVWNLGAGLHGLGRRGLLLIVGGAALVTALVVYTEVLSRYGASVLVDPFERAADWSGDNLGGVPRPVEAVLGFPALLWGVATRSERRQGWWICAFGVLGTAAVATTLAAPRLDPAYAGISLGYSAAIGLVLGLVVLRIDRALAGSNRSGRRAARTASAVGTRPEPARSHPLR